MGSEKAILSAVDYALIILTLIISAAIGLYFRFSGGKQKTINEYLLAGKDMSILPVAFSIMASYLSAVTFIGSPTDVYMFGIHLLFSNLTYPVFAMVASYVCLPVFFQLGVCTAYEYLEKRFGNLTRIFTSVLFLFQTMLYTAVVLYAPALALSAVTNLSTWTSVLSIGVVSTFYCSLGGMKAVLWTDLFQAFLMFIGIFTIVIKGFLDIGFSEIFRIGYEGGRITFPKFSLSLTERYTIWNLIVHSFVMQTIMIGANQIQIQRLLTLRNISRCRKALCLGICLNAFFSALACAAGLVIYAYFYKCDPLTAPNKPIYAADQILPYYVINTQSEFSGLPGLCICGIFGASLSTVSSAMNSLSAVTMQDLVRPFLQYRRYSENTMAFAAKALTVFYGVLCILLTVMAAFFGNLIQATIIVWEMCGVPILAVFLLGMLTTRTNEKGALIGLLSSLCIAAWVSFGASAKGPRPKILPFSTEGCPANFSSINETSSIFSANNTSWFPESTIVSTTFTVPKINLEARYVFPLYKISYLWYGPLGLLVGLIVGYVSSIIINCITGKYPDVSEEFVSPVLIKFLQKKKDVKSKSIDTQEQETESLTTRESIQNSTV